RYDPDKDIFLCPGDQVLSPRHYGKSRDNVKIDYTNRAACKACHLRERCTKSFRRVSRLENEAVLDRMAARPGPTFSTGGARASSIRSARSSNG
ncbi:hypothetical protein AB3480_35530, partial [Rhizobium mongolense]